MNITQTLAQKLAATPAQITAAVALLDDGATVSFIARYRKEATGRAGQPPIPHQIISMTKQRNRILPPVIKSGNNRDTVAWAYHPEPPATP